MSRPRYAWWGYVKSMIRLYPARMDELRRRQEANITSGYGGAAGEGQSRATENLATVSLGDLADREVDAVRTAIEITKELPHGTERLQLIRMVYWQRTHTLAGASMACGISEATGKRWNGDFIRVTAEKFFSR